MPKTLSIFLFLIISASLSAQSLEALRQELQGIVAGKQARVGIAFIGTQEDDTLSIRGEEQFPMQSVFKFHIGAAMLSEIDKGKYTLQQKIKIKKSELLPGLWSPIREKYPQGATLSIAEILKYTIVQSDNVGCDVLLRLLGGPAFVENYMHEKGLKDIAIKINEETMQGHWERQFENWTTPKAANEALRYFFQNSQQALRQRSYDFLWETMKETSTGLKRLKGDLPAGTIVAHKTGWSGTHKETGITAAVNDIGIVFLPNGKPYFVSVFISDSRESTESNEKIIAEVSKALWDFCISK